MIDKKINKVIGNTSLLYVMQFFKIALPLLILPYLTRVLSIDCYGVTTYVKSYIIYMQLLIGFGFLLSATKEISENRDNPHIIGEIAGKTILAKALIAIAAVIITFFMCLSIPILANYKLFTFLSLLFALIEGFLPDFIFRGIEKMRVITLRFIIAKFISTSLTFICVKGDGDILWLPILDIIGTSAATFFSWREVSKLGIHVYLKIPFRKVLETIKDSSIYFISNIATTAFGALNTLLIGLYLQESDIALWSVSLNLVAAAQTLYTPILDGIYPYMVKEKNTRLIKNICLTCVPLITATCIILALFSEKCVVLIFGSQYAAAAPVFTLLLPVLVFSFPAMVLGFPTLGAISKVHQITLTTIATAISAIAMLALLIAYNKFNLLNIAIARSAAEVILFTLRASFVIKYFNVFKK